MIVGVVVFQLMAGAPHFLGRDTNHRLILYKYTDAGVDIDFGTYWNDTRWIYDGGSIQASVARVDGDRNGFGVSPHWNVNISLNIANISLSISRSEIEKNVKSIGKTRTFLAE